MAEDQKEKDDKGAVDLSVIEMLVGLGTRYLPLSDEGKKHLKKTIEHLLKTLDDAFDVVDKAIDVDD